MSLEVKAIQRLGTLILIVVIFFSVVLLLLLLPSVTYFVAPDTFSHVFFFFDQDFACQTKVRWADVNVGFLCQSKGFDYFFEAFIVEEVSTLLDLARFGRLKV